MVSTSRLQDFEESKSFGTGRRQSVQMNRYQEYREISVAVSMNVQIHSGTRGREQAANIIDYLQEESHDPGEDQSRDE